mgnify:CR=1 FL=1
METGIIGKNPDLGKPSIGIHQKKLAMSLLVDVKAAITKLQIWDKTSSPLFRTQKLVNTQRRI